MDSILILKNRQDLQDQQDIIPTRVPNETGWMQSASRKNGLSILRHLNFLLSADKPWHKEFGAFRCQISAEGGFYFYGFIWKP